MKRRRLLIGIVASLAIGGIAFAYALPKLAGYTAVWRVISALPWWWVALLAAVTALNIATFVPPWTIVLRGLGFLRGLQMTQASTAFGLVVPGGAPLGMAVSFAILRSAGFERERVSLAVTLTGLWNQLSTFLFPLLAIALLAVAGNASRTLQIAAFLGGVAALVAVAAGVLALWRQELSRRIGDLAATAVSWIRRLTGHGPVRWDGEAVVRYRRSLLGQMRRHWPTLTIATFANQLAGYLLLEASVRAMGIGLSQLSLPETFAAWSVARLLTSLPLTPGGLGVVELGLSGMMVGFGAPHAPVVAAVLVFRALSIVPTLVLGVVSWATWRRAST